MATEIQNINASQLTESTEVTDSNCVVMTDDATSEEVKAMNLKDKGLTSTQEQQLNVAYAHSQSAHVQSSDIPTKISVLENDRPFVTLTEMTTAINDAQLGGGNNDIDLSIYQPIQDDTLTVNSKIIPAAINELKGIIDTLLNRIIELENQQGATIGVTGVSLNHNALTLNVGDTNTLTATISPSNATNQSVIWSTNNSSVATVSNGVVTAVSTGSAIITVATVDGNYTATCSITVSDRTISVTGVSLSTHSVEMSSIGETYTINYTISPTNATNKNITWSSSEPTVATIKDNLITAKGDGTTIISIRTVDGDFSDTCTVTVDTSAVVAGSYITDESENRLMAEDGFYLITD